MAGAVARGFPSHPLTSLTLADLTIRTLGVASPNIAFPELNLNQSSHGTDGIAIIEIEINDLMWEYRIVFKTRRRRPPI